MEELRFALLILGGCAIVAILAHGLWSLRKNTTSNLPRKRVEPVSDSPRSDGFDEYGLSEVRVIGEVKSQKKSVHDEKPFHNKPSGDHLSSDEPSIVVDDDDKDNLATRDEEVASEVDSNQPDSNNIPDIKDWDVSKPTLVEVPEEAPKKLYGSVVSNPKPAVKPVHVSNKPKTAESSAIPEPPPFLLQTDNEPETPPPAEQTESAATAPAPDFQLDQTPGDLHNHEASQENPSTDTISLRKRAKGSPRRRVEPSIGEDQMRIDFDEEARREANTPPIQSEDGQPQTEQPTPPSQEVLVLNVKAPSGEEISGAALLPMLLTLGFKFGDQDIFHRHVNSNGKGPVLFSLANMFKPGIFDIDNLETFTTKGVSLFMILPIEGDPHQVFNMMHNAARKLADEFGCQILDGRRSVLTKQGLQQYVEKIREFERQRIISRH
ncbi:cell division protein ZipA [Alteromonas oceanisediminis]|uniref:cell division protein ZipA n=1 Tax=Alteromonas oceanisediminis TaxID=2836180 RepID=UPI001BDA46BC|nr:cell division protein ZipA [Alteromonas oceanisediminis]MBT0586505.1 cell division protein ZipA [Alteromonas oceanisediminis]